CPLPLFSLTTTPTTPSSPLSLHDALPISILALADPDDRDGDGISGRAGRAPDGRFGRFGRKAEFATLREFIDGALRFELGITTRSEEHTSELQSLAYLVCRLLLEKKKNIE